MSIRREYLLFTVAAVLTGMVALAGILNLTQPFARFEPHPKWANITEEPHLNVHMADTGGIQRMGLETYLQGVVAAEIQNTWPLEALKAQAIIARTFTVEELQRRGGVAGIRPGADVSTDDTIFQAYDAAKVNDNIRRAVEETRGQILTFRGVPVRALFHADAGGMTASPEEGLGQDFGPLPYLREVRVPWLAPDTEWTETFSREEVRRAAADTGNDPGNFDSVAIGERGPSGRAVTLNIGNASVPAPEFRLAIGSTRMRSTLLTSVSMADGRVTFSGRGFGHGVGMSQWGAYGMAEQGRRAEAIATFFFPGARISTIWD
jgi:stage II sporulation protein D